MELAPRLTIGWLNGWILLALLFGVFGVLLLIFPKPVVRALYAYDRSTWSRRQRVLARLKDAVDLACFVLISFAPLKIGSPLLLAGLGVYAVGLALFVVALFNFKDRPLDQPGARGLYRVSRHPQVLGLAVATIGMALAVGSWSVLLAIALSALFGHDGLLAEEQACIERYGDLYREFMKRVPRYFLFL